MKEEKISLEFRSGSSDKVYYASLENKPGGWMVNFAYGRRGSALTTGCKGSALDYESAKKIYDKLCREKTVKGYVLQNGDSSPIFSVSASRKTHWIPQLLNEVGEEEIEKYIKDDEWCMQEKFDGRNRLLIREKDGSIGTNRKGLTVDIPKGVQDDMKDLESGTVLSGEAIGDNVVCFDMISLKGESYVNRYRALHAKLEGKTNIWACYTAFTEKDKRDLFKKLKRDNAEGVVFKNVIAHYTPGRPATGGSQLKFKFYATASVIAGAGKEGKRSVEMFVWKDQSTELVSVGNVTVYPNQEIPKSGDILEVKYLYAYKGGSLFQPVLLGVRDDIEETECTMAQLKYKQEN